MTITIQTRADLFAATALCISKESTRYYLCGVNFQAEKGSKTVIAATDGSILTVATDGAKFEGYSAVNVIIAPTPELIKACKNKDATTVSFEISIETPEKSPITWTVGNEYGVLSRGFTNAIDGDFPEYRRVIPNESFPEAPVPAISHTYYKVITDIAKTALVTKGLDDFKKPPKGRGIKIINGDPHANDNSPCFVKYSDTMNIFSIVMPLRGEKDMNEIPNFF